MTSQVDGSGPGRGPRCAFCGYPIVDDGATGGSTAAGRFCSTTCRDAAADGETPFAGQHDYKYVRSGVRALDELLPSGFRTDSLVLLRGDAGTSRRELQFELAWRAIRRGEPVIYVSYVDPPAAVVEQFLALGWNVLPALERDQLFVVDCFTRRLSDSEAFDESKNGWKRHVTRALDGATAAIRNPDDLREVENRLGTAVSELEMTNAGLVVLDSLDEVGTLVSDPQIENMLKEVRADVCQNRYVPLVAGRAPNRSMGPVQRQRRVAGGGLSTDLTYFVDGIVDLRLNTRLAPNSRLTQLSIRRMQGVRFVPQWRTFAFVRDGHVPVDPPAPTSAVAGPGQRDDGATSDSPTPRRALPGAASAPAATSGTPTRPTGSAANTRATRPAPFQQQRL